MKKITSGITILKNPLKYRYDIEIEIEKDNNGRWIGRFRARDTRDPHTVHLLGYNPQIQIRIDNDDLISRNAELEDIFKKLSHSDKENDENVDGILLDMESKTYKPLIRELARIGHELYKEILKNFNSTQEKKFKEWLEECHYINVLSPEFPFTWEILYPQAIGKEIDLQEFWGFRYIISRLLPDVMCIPEIKCSRYPTIRLFVYSQLTSVDDERRCPNYLHNFENEKKIDLKIFESFNDREKALEEIKRFLSEKLDIVHFTCHGDLDTHLGRYWIIIDDNIEVYSSDIVRREFHFNGNPLFFLNACNTGNINPKYHHNWANNLLGRGAGGVITTECCVSDRFATQFAEEVYKKLLDGQELGPSLQLIRILMLKRYNNPQGLLYSIYAQPSTRLVKGNEG